MSNGSSPSSPRRVRGAVAVTCTVLVPACVVGGLVWQALTGDAAGDGRGGDGRPGDGPSAAWSRDTGEPDGPAPGPEDRPSASAGPGGAPETGKPLSGKVVVVDPGHNPGNREHPREINASVDIGTNSKPCDTTGTATNDGYAEAEFTLDVARRIRAILEKQGAEVRFTHDDDRPYGPCVDERAEIGNKADADAAVSVHADGSGAGNRGFHVILPGPVKEGGADTGAIVGPSRELGERIVGRFVRETGSKPSNYIGGGTGLDVRSDLGGLNLSEVPKVFVECGNMRDPQDAGLLTSAKWRQSAARGIADGIALHLDTTAGKDS